MDIQTEIKKLTDEIGELREVKAKQDQYRNLLNQYANMGEQINQLGQQLGSHVETGNQISILLRGKTQMLEALKEA